MMPLMYHTVYVSPNIFVMTETINVYFIYRCTLQQFIPHATIISTEGQDLIMNGGGGINNKAIIYLRRN